MSLKAIAPHIAIVLALMSTVAFAEQTSGGDNGTGADNEIYTLEQVTVVGQSDDQLTGSNSLDRIQLEKLPVKNGSVNEAISILPGLQLTEESRPSLTAGEILPPLISISGGKAYQNNFQIDGATSNDLINPNFTSPKNIDFVPGHPQTLFLNTRLIEEVDVYRYNVPASLGNFTGGVIDVKTRKPEYNFWGEVFYRTTRSDWTESHVDSAIVGEFDASRSETYQPEFERHDAGILLNIPLNNKFSLLTAYQINYSEIPLWHIGQTKNQKRRNENFLAKLLWEIDREKEITLQVQHSPYKADYFTKNAKDSDYTIEAGSTLLSLAYDQQLKNIDMKLFAAGKWSQTDRNAPTDLREWLANIGGEPSTKPWGNITGDLEYGDYVSSEGGIGPLESSQKGYQLKADFAIKEPAENNNSVKQDIKFGVGLEQVHGKFIRPVATSIYSLTKEKIDGETQYINDNPDYIGDLDCSTVSPIACIDEPGAKQILLKRQHFPEGSSSATINFLDAYIEDKLEWHRFQVRPGLRFSYNDFMENIDIAPRVSSSLDLFGNGKTILMAGWNRYFGKTLMYYKLREGSEPYNFEERAIDPSTGIPDTSWVKTFGDTKIYKFSELKTPYSDETVLGLDNELLEGRLRLNWVHREGHDEFSRERTDSKQVDGFFHYTMTNLGRTHHDEYTLEWERQWKDSYFGVNLTYQETKTTSDSYLEDYETEDLDDEVWYEGKVIPINEIPRQDFNRPWVANLIYTTRLPANLTFTNVTKYKSGYEGLFRIIGSGEKAALGVPTGINAYRRAKKADSVIFDWRLDWEKRFVNDRKLVISLEVNNVFNTRALSGEPSVQVPVTQPSNESTYELGRQFWLGMTYKF